MEDVFKAAVQLATEGSPFALCTVVGTIGSTPQKPGAMLLVKADGTGVGTLGGGCVEADVWAEAKTALDSDTGPTVGDFELNDDLAAESGMVCGGTMAIMVDPLRRPGSAIPWVTEILNAYSGGKGIAVATISGPEGSDRLGTKMYIREDGTSDGSLGSADDDAQAVKASRDLLVHGGTHTMRLSDDTEAFIQGFVSPPHLVLCGGGHISHATAPLAKTLGFLVTVIDDRPDFANRERFPMADNIVVDELDAGLRGLDITPNTFIVIATRGHKLDDEATLAAARSPAGFIGLVGSVRKSILIFEELFAEGVPYERVAEIRSPVGLDIGARTPEEIALSIIAEIQQVRLGGKGGPLKMPEKHVRTAAAKAKKRAKTAV